MEEEKFWEEHGKEIPAEIENEINGEDILSLEQLQEEEYEREC